MIRSGSLLPAAVTVLMVGCLESLKEAPDSPASAPSGAVFLGNVLTATGAAVVGATGDINIYREDATYVGGRSFTTDQAGEFAETIILAYAGAFEASVQIMIVPPSDLGLLPNIVTGSVPFTSGVTDTLRVTITLSEAEPTPESLHGSHSLAAGESERGSR